MTQTIDPIALKAAAEHLEWVCQQYPTDEPVQALYRALQALIDSAKAGNIAAPLERHTIPARWAVSAEGLYRDYQTPSVEEAYTAFGIQLEGGLTEQEERILAKFAARAAAQSREQKGQP